MLKNSIKERRMNLSFATCRLEQHLSPCDGDNSATLYFCVLPLFEIGIIHPDAIAPVRMNVPSVVRLAISQLSVRPRYYFAWSQINIYRWLVIAAVMRSGFLSGLSSMEPIWRSSKEDLRGKNVVCPLPAAYLCESIDVSFAISLFSLVVWVLFSNGDRVGGGFQIRYDKIGGIFGFVIDGRFII